MVKSQVTKVKGTSPRNIRNNGKEIRTNNAYFVDNNKGVL